MCGKRPIIIIIQRSKKPETFCKNINGFARRSYSRVEPISGLLSFVLLLRIARDQPSGGTDIYTPTWVNLEDSSKLKNR